MDIDFWVKNFRFVLFLGKKFFFCWVRFKFDILEFGLLGCDVEINESRVSRFGRRVIFGNVGGS